MKNTRGLLAGRWIVAHPREATKPYTHPYPPRVQGRFRTDYVRRSWQKLSSTRKWLASWWITLHCPTTEVIGVDMLGIWWNDWRGSTHLELWQDVCVATSGLR